MNDDRNSSFGFHHPASTGNEGAIASGAECRTAAGNRGHRGRGPRSIRSRQPFPYQSGALFATTLPRRFGRLRNAGGYQPAPRRCMIPSQDPVVDADHDFVHARDRRTVRWATARARAPSRTPDIPRRHLETGAGRAPVRPRAGASSSRTADNASPSHDRRWPERTSVHSTSAFRLRTIVTGSAVRKEKRPSRVPGAALSRNSTVGKSLELLTAARRIGSGDQFLDEGLRHQITMNDDLSIDRISAEQ